MSVIDFTARLAALEAAAARAEGKLDQLKNKIDNVKGPMDELISQAERTGSAVGNVNGVIIEAVRMSGDAVPTLQGVAWEMYKITETIEERAAVSRDVLDQLAKQMDSFVPQYDLWTKHWLALVEQGQMSLDELEKTVEDWFNSPGILQMNSMLHGDIPNFLLNFRKMMKEIRGDVDGLTEKTNNLNKAAEAARETTSGMASAGGGSSSMGAATTSDTPSSGGLSAALTMTRGRG